VRRFARAASIDELLAEATGRESKPDPFRPYICQRWNEGLTDAAALYAELQQRGFTGSVRTVRRYVAPFRQAATAPDPAPAMPKTRQVTRWLLTRPDHLQPEEQAQLNAIRASCPHIDTLARHVASFAEFAEEPLSGRLRAVSRGRRQRCRIIRAMRFARLSADLKRGQAEHNEHSDPGL